LASCERLLSLLGSGQAPGRVDRCVERFSDARGGITGFSER
ncbi:MAG: hypothetical protein QOK10_2217, partial [Pseudonocardiales bacterium]|nr:hypothetical protein [Pseudonocardiales bacterium]